jgi:hypothetical protein
MIDARGKLSSRSAHGELTTCIPGCSRDEHLLVFDKRMADLSPVEERPVVQPWRRSS